MDGHSFNLDEEYGYKKFKSGEDLTKGLCDMYYNDIVPAIKNGLNAAVLTQVSDVEDETNGIATYDRQVIKTDSEKMLAMAEALFNTFKETVE